MLSRLIPAVLVIVVASFYASSHGAALNSPLASDLDSSTTSAPPECMDYCNTTECFDHVNASANVHYYECRHCNGTEQQRQCSNGCLVNRTSSPNQIQCVDYSRDWPPGYNNCSSTTTSNSTSDGNSSSNTIVIVASVVSAFFVILIIAVTVGVIVFFVKRYRKRKGNVEPQVSKEQEEIAVMFPKTPVDEAIVEPAVAEPKLTLQQLLPDNKKSSVSIDQALATAGAQETEAVFLGEHRADRDLTKRKRQKPTDDLETKEVFTDQAKIDEKHHEPQKETSKENKVIRGKTAAADEPTKDRTMNDVPSNSRNTINAPMETPKDRKAANKETKEESTYDSTKEEKAGKALPSKKVSADKVANAKKGLMKTTDVQDELDAADKLTGS